MEETILIQFLKSYLESSDDVTDIVGTRIYSQIPDVTNSFPKLTFVSFGGLKRGNANCFYGENLYFGIFVDVPKDDLFKESLRLFMETLDLLFENQTVAYDGYSVEIKRMNSISPVSKYIDEMKTHVTRLGFQIQLRIK
jgi:hypothetical protein